MSVLVGAADLLARRRLIAGSKDLSAVRQGLEDDVARVLARPLYLPEAKALLSRWGGTCRDDKSDLVFDPFSPRAQRCATCGKVWSDEQTHRWWITWYQLWLAERVLIMALLAGDGGNAAAESRAQETLAVLAERYGTWPNADNVLGPTRPFFSTYLESIWILHLAAATSVLQDQGRLPADLWRDLETRLFPQSAAIIADFDEGRSNRQVWNAAALYAVGRLVGDEAMARSAAHGDSGLLASLRKNVLADGLWYEGENYHWFALRGLVWGAEMLRTAGEVDLWHEAGAEGQLLRAAFTAPLLTALPDFTFPARRDSKFGVSLRQRRMAEMWELALARGGRRQAAVGDRQEAAGDSDVYASLLAYVYDPAIAEGSNGSSEITEVERGVPPEGVRRGQLGWKGLLWALPALPQAEPDAWRPGTVHLESTGLAVFRRDEGTSYVSLDYGESGGGHGHPDRLNLTAVVKGVPWLLDFGTGSYVATSLNWYRASLAHNAPLLDGVSQLPADGACIAFDEQGDWGWVCGYLPESTAFDHAEVQRTVVVAPDYVLDVVQMRSESGDRQLALPWHGLGKPLADEHGLSFTRGDGERLRILLTARQPFNVLLQRAPGPTQLDGSSEDLDYQVVIATGEQLTLAACLDTGDVVHELECVDEDFLVRRTDGGLHVHRATDDGWEVELDRGDPIRLGGLRQLPEEPRPEPPATSAPPVETSPLFLNRADQFRRAEEPWGGPDDFSATASVSLDGDELVVTVDVVAPAPCFRPTDAADPEWENENPDIHSDGIQLYLETVGFYGWLIVPDTDGKNLRVAAVRGTDAEVEMITGGQWQATERGYGLQARITLNETPQGDVGFDLYVNRARQGKERRVGQLVWSGARGTRLYLAGDRPLPGPLPRVKL